MTAPNPDPVIIVERRGRVGLITLNRPQALNALTSQVMQETVAACTQLDRDPEIGCIVITGSAKAFAGGADIKQMQPLDYQQMYAEDYFSDWDLLTRVRTPVIAAVAGFALGGGCELAMMCDLIIAADNAKFGQPEVKLGVLPGMGGTQRLTRIVGKARAMDMCLTGRLIDASEAERFGLVARVVPAADLLNEALQVAGTIAEMSKPVTQMITESVDRAYETTLTEGVRFERRLFHAVFATADQAEGMEAFISKRPPKFTHR